MVGRVSDWELEPAGSSPVLSVVVAACAPNGDGGRKTADRDGASDTESETKGETHTHTHTHTNTNGWEQKNMQKNIQTKICKSKA